MGNRTRRKASSQSTNKSSTSDRRPTSRGSNNGGRTPTKPKGSQFGTSSTDQENHVHVPPELMPDIYGNEFMNTMLA